MLPKQLIEFEMLQCCYSKKKKKYRGGGMGAVKDIEQSIW